MLKYVEVEKINTIQITSLRSAFNTEIHGWQEAYFQVMAYQNTFDFAYQTAIHSNRDHEAYLWLLLKEDADQDRIIEWLTDLGYGNLKIDEVTVGEVNTYDLDVDYIAEV